jgi:uncharacterized membrane protein (DUF2068 family)
MHHSATIRTIALFEGAKGVLVFLAGFGMLSLLHRDLEALAGTAVAHLHLSPSSHFPSIFLRAASRMTDARLWMYAALAAVYGIFRLAEAYGLWRERAWAECLAVASGGIYIPFEVYGVVHGKGWVAVVALAINIAIVVIMLRALQRKRRLQVAAQAAAPAGRPT